MAGYFALTLDTTPPENITVKLNNGARYAETPSATLTVSTSDQYTDGYEMKVFGDIDGNVSSEDTAIWKDYRNSQTVTLSSEDGNKYVHVLLKDDVGNVSNQYSARIYLNTSGEPIIEPSDFYSYEGIGTAATFFLDNKTRDVLGYELRSLMGKVVTLTGDYIVGFGNSGDNPLGHVEHIAYESGSSDNLVVTVSWCNTVNVPCGMNVKSGDWLSCDGKGGFQKSLTKTSAKAWNVFNGICTAYISG